MIFKKKIQKMLTEKANKINELMQVMMWSIILNNIYHTQINQCGILVAKGGGELRLKNGSRRRNQGIFEMTSLDKQIKINNCYNPI